MCDKLCSHLESLVEAVFCPLLCQQQSEVEHGKSVLAVETEGCLVAFLGMGCVSHVEVDCSQVVVGVRITRAILHSLLIGEEGLVTVIQLKKNISLVHVGLHKVWLHGESSVVQLEGLLQPTTVQFDKVSQVVEDIDVPWSYSEGFPLGNEIHCLQVSLEGEINNTGVYM